VQGEGLGALPPARVLRDALVRVLLENILLHSLPGGEGGRFVHDAQDSAVTKTSTEGSQAHATRAVYPPAGSCATHLLLQAQLYLRRLLQLRNLVGRLALGLEHHLPLLEVHLLARLRRGSMGAPGLSGLGVAGGCCTRCPPDWWGAGEGGG